MDEAPEQTTSVGDGTGDDEPATGRLRYRLLTGPDDRAFCERVSAALADGYVLHGPPSIATSGDRTVVAQAVVLPED